MATTGDETLADEQRRRIPAGVAAISAGILTIVGGAVTAAVFTDRPTVPVLDALNEHLDTGAAEPGLKARQVLWVDENAVKLVLLGVMLALAALAIGIALSYLYRSVKARRPELPRAVLIALVAGTALLSVASLVQAVGSVISAAAFADSAQQTAAAARDAQASQAVLAAGLMQVVGVFAFAVSFVLLALNGMRVGLLTRFMGVLGIIVGALFIIPLGSSLPIVQAFWLVRAGRAVPRALAGGDAARVGHRRGAAVADPAGAARGAYGEASRPRSRRGAPAPHRPPRARGAARDAGAGAPRQRRPHSSSKKKKRKRR